MIDSHCHLDDPRLAADRAQVLWRARARGVTDIVVPAVDRASWARLRELCATGAPWCHPAVGVHPVALVDAPGGSDEALLDALDTEARRPGTVGIGECGLDTTVDLGRAPLARQERILSAQLDLARALGLPLVLHARGPGCYVRLLDFLEARPIGPAGGVLHSYGGGAELLRRYLELPLSFGFAGPATYVTAHKVRSSIRMVPAALLLAETDAPDQTPEPHRPGRNEPAFVAEVIAGLAAARGEDPVGVAQVTAQNARRLFRLG